MTTNYYFVASTGVRMDLCAAEDSFYIGRDVKLCKFSFTSPFVSRRHCQIQRIPPHGTLLIRNLKETNGTYLDLIHLNQVDQVAELRIGSRVGLGVPVDYCGNKGVILTLCGDAASHKSDESTALTLPSSSASVLADVGIHCRHILLSTSVLESSLPLASGIAGPSNLMLKDEGDSDIEFLEEVPSSGKYSCTTNTSCSHTVKLKDSEPKVNRKRERDDDVAQEGSVCDMGFAGKRLRTVESTCNESAININITEMLSGSQESGDEPICSSFKSVEDPNCSAVDLGVDCDLQLNIGIGTENMAIQNKTNITESANMKHSATRSFNNSEMCLSDCSDNESVVVEQRMSGEVTDIISKDQILEPSIEQSKHKGSQNKCIIKKLQNCANPSDVSRLIDIEVRMDKRACTVPLCKIPDSVVKIMQDKNLPVHCASEFVPQGETFSCPVTTSMVDYDSDELPDLPSYAELFQKKEENLSQVTITTIPIIPTQTVAPDSTSNDTVQSTVCQADKMEFVNSDCKRTGHDVTIDKMQNIKKEVVTDSMNQLVSSDSEDDDLMIAYSQVDDIIWVSSDEDDIPNKDGLDRTEDDLTIDAHPFSPDSDIEFEEIFRVEPAGFIKKEFEVEEQWRDVLSQSLSDEATDPNMEPNDLDNIFTVDAYLEQFNSDVDVATEAERRKVAHHDVNMQKTNSNIWVQDKDPTLKANNILTPDAYLEQFNSDIDVAPETERKKVNDHDVNMQRTNCNIRVQDKEGNESQSDWWPQLSQNFFNDHIVENATVKELDHGHKGKIAHRTNDCVEKSVSGISKNVVKNLNKIVNKVSNQNIKKSKLTDPKTPPHRTKADNLRVKGVLKKDQTVASSARVDAEGNVNQNAAPETSTSRSEILVGNKRSLKQTKKSKRSGIRESLTERFELNSYKIPKLKTSSERVHPVLARTSEECHLSDLNRINKINLVSNISVQNNTKNNMQYNSHVKARPKVVAKITKKTRAEKLAEETMSVPVIRRLGTAQPKMPHRLSSEMFISNPSVTSVDKFPRRNSTADFLRQQPSTSGVPDVTDASVVCSEIKSFTKNVEREDTILNDLQSLSKPTGRIAHAQPPKGILMAHGQTTSNQRKRNVSFPNNSQEMKTICPISPRLSQKAQPAINEYRPKRIHGAQEEYIIPKNYMDEFIFNICRWNYDWLESYFHQRKKFEFGGKLGIKLPPVTSNMTGALPLLILYQSFADYKEIFRHLMYIEAWESLYQDWLRIRDNIIWCAVQVSNVVRSKSFDNIPHHCFWNLQLNTFLSKDQLDSKHCPKMGSLVVLKLRSSTDHKASYMLGHVACIIRNSNMCMAEELKPHFPRGQFGMRLSVTVAKDVGNMITCGNMIYMSNLAYIRPCLRTWEGLCKLPLSPLCPSILQPEHPAFVDPPQDGPGYLMDSIRLNPVQKAAVVRVANKCVYQPQMPKISLIHGPPGTGKTRTILALVMQIMELCNRLKQECRILLCAPSNAAVDELSLRLRKMKEVNVDLRLVRVGVHASVNPALQKCHLDELVKEFVQEELFTPKNPSAAKEYERKKQMVASAELDLKKLQLTEGSAVFVVAAKQRLEILRRAKEEFENGFVVHPTNGYQRQQLHRKWQATLLKGAQIVATTLGGCVSGAMADVFIGDGDKKNGPPRLGFTCCIVDEAGQSKETEMWLPLLLGVTKLVLVGDHKQLPATVLSQMAQDKQLRQSLFERIHHRIVVEMQQPSLIHGLTMQYRMHPQIMAWPSKQFYNGSLTTADKVQYERTFALKPYLLFDVQDSQEVEGRPGELHNPQEATFVCMLLEQMEPFLAGQKGQEKDVVILSFVRANRNASIGFLSHWQRLNVALTRARRSCYIVANCSSLEGNADWGSLINDAHVRGVRLQVKSSTWPDTSALQGMIRNHEWKTMDDMQVRARRRSSETRRDSS